MGCRVERIEISKSAALGAALQAAHGWLAAGGKNPKWDKLVVELYRPGARQRDPAQPAGNQESTTNCSTDTPSAKPDGDVERSAAVMAAESSTMRAHPHTVLAQLVQT